MFPLEFQEWSNFGQAHLFRLYIIYQLLLSQSVTMGTLMFLPAQASEQSQVEAG